MCKIPKKFHESVRLRGAGVYYFGQIYNGFYNVKLALQE